MFGGELVATAAGYPAHRESIQHHCRTGSTLEAALEHQRVAEVAPRRRPGVLHL
ncbi:MAG TPA: hypothetical protein VK869_04125 [Rubrobacteraceae bacterium]|nr:hypothetical protein [Rubrobacteraceae bacterium]